MENLTFEQVLQTLQKIPELHRDVIEIKRLLTNQSGRKAEEPDRKHTIPSAASFIGITPATFYSKRSRGELPPGYKPAGSKKVYYFEKDLLDYLKNGKEGNSYEEATYLKRKGGKNG